MFFFQMQSENWCHVCSENLFMKLEYETVQLLQWCSAICCFKKVFCFKKVLQLNAIMKKNFFYILYKIGIFFPHFCSIFEHWSEIKVQLKMQLRAEFLNKTLILISILSSTSSLGGELYEMSCKRCLCRIEKGLVASFFCVRTKVEVRSVHLLNSRILIFSSKIYSIGLF